MPIFCPVHNSDLILRKYIVKIRDATKCYTLLEKRNLDILLSMNRYYSPLPFLLFLLTYTAAQNQAMKPKVLIITTGGTIASRSGVPMIEGPALVNAVPQLANYAEIKVEEFSRIGSSKMTPDHWLGLARRVNELFRSDPDLAGIIITHGTDTMEETAFFLHLTVKTDRPVILVGAMRSANEVSADGPANLLNAVRVAVCDQARDQGVLLVLNEDIASARDVRKMDNRRVETFRSDQWGFLGVADPDTVAFYRKLTRPHTVHTDFSIEGVDRLPKVEMVMDYTGFDAAIVDHFVGRGSAGLVFRSFAGGRTSAGGMAGIRRASEAGLPVVIASGVPNGRIIGRPVDDFPIVYAHHFSPVKARILLMLCLLQTDDPKAIQRIFEQY